jgi:O-antigen ligase
MIPAALILTAISGWQGIPGRRAVRLGWPELAMLIFAGLALTNIATLNPDPVDTVRELYDEVIIPFCVYLLIRLTSPDEKDYKRFLWVAFVTLLIQCTIGIVGWFAPSAVPQQWTLGGERTVGSLLNADVYSSTILFLALLLLHFGLQQRSRLVRDATVSLFGLALFCVFISFSRSSWVGGLALVAGLTLLYPKAVVRLLIVLTVSVLILGNTLFADEFAFAQQRLTSAESQRSANNRVISNNTSLLMLQAKPLFGWGYNTYEKNMQPFVTRVGDVPAVLGYNVASHNTYLTILVELGAIAFLFYMFPVFWWFIQSFRVRKRLPLDGFMSRRLLGVLWLLVLQMFVVSNFLDVIRFFPFGTTLWWLALGMIASLVTSHANPSSYPQK